MFVSVVLYADILILFTMIGVAVFSKKRNVGYVGHLGHLISTLCVLVCCLFIVSSKTPHTVNTAFSFYYISIAWFYFFTSVVIYNLNFKRHFVIYKCPNFYLCLFINALMIYNLFTESILGSMKHIMIGTSWWIIHIKSRELFTVMNIVLILMLAYICIILAVEFLNASRIFISRAIGIAVCLTFYIVLSIVSNINTWPSWINTMYIGLIGILFFYWYRYYAPTHLIRSSMLSFANNLSEGFILYDSRGNLVYINNLLKGILKDSQIETFHNKSDFVRWASDIERIEGIPVKRIKYIDRDMFVRIYEHPLSDARSDVGTFFNIKDTTDSINQIKAMERINEELEQTARMKSDFLANMSHEIRTPMNAVIGMAEMALREDLPPNALNYINQIKTSGHNLLNIINDILDYSKIESGKMDIIPDKYEPISEYQDIANTLMTRIVDKDIELMVNVDPSIPYVLEGDSMRIRQVLINLANNAIKFTKEGFVQINVSYKKLSDAMVNIIIHIVDSGIGIKPEDLKKLFVSFTQVDSKRNRMIEGTGLGLAISKSLVEAMGGQIGVTSEYEKGSDFYFEIPQKVVDITPSMSVNDSENLNIFGLIKKDILAKDFLDNINTLGISHSLITDLNEVRNFLNSNVENRHCYLFFEQESYDDELKSLLDEYKNLTGVIIVDFDSFFTAEQSNLRVMRKPFTTLAISLILNNKSMNYDRRGDSFSFDFSANSARILIVDDNAINITVAQGLLDPLGMEIHTALSGKDAINLVKHNPYDIIFMDHMMPEMDGIETTKYIRDNIPEAVDTPIIALTANAMSGAKDMFLSNGMNDFVSKPIELKAIVSKVKQWLPPEKIEKNHTIVVAPSVDEEVDIPGLDTKAAMELIGSAALYKKVSYDYLLSIDANYDAILNSYGNEDWADYTIKVHALKSSSRQIGATTLASKAEKLENAGHEKDIEYINQNTADLLTEYQRVKDILVAQYGVPVVEEIELVEYDKDTLISAINKLKAGCDDLDMDAMEEVSEELKKYIYNDAQKEIVTELIAAIDEMNIEACMNGADLLLSSLG